MTGSTTLLFRISIALPLALIALSGCRVIKPTQTPQPGTGEITARMLVAPGALMGPGPSSFSWSPVGATLTYVAPQDDRDVLWAYDPATDAKRLLLDPGENPEQIDLSSVQWSPQGDLLLLSGASALWLLDPKTSALQSLAKGSHGITSLMFSPDGTRIAYVLDNDLYTIRISDGLIDRLTTGGWVVDFLNVGVGPLRTGIFNVADVAIMAGVVLLLVQGTRKSGSPAR